ncbi:GNAT family N-acetyltransferase [Tabrizicola sp.]|uniref:GNAT family N-acetyltransferase n=1 Tax=Tabrizicola sp. TaxID=2005166 RepID=UPI002736ABF3|nr:GNAT family N-acetyltransferase [Tabrizicola sp.]MDP3193654.1 GNAT family N-acetyltransferase [Tabrizicola sp.]
MIVRNAAPADAAGMTALLNAVIAAGGTTALETPMTGVDVRDHFIDGPGVLSSVLAEEDGKVLGWQSVGWWHDDPHIGTFVLPGLQAKGIGSALFAKTLAELRGGDVDRIIAWIRADNVPGLAYYARIGFRDIGGDPGFALKDGTIVGRIHRQFDLV